MCISIGIIWVLHKVITVAKTNNILNISVICSLFILLKYALLTQKNDFTGLNLSSKNVLVF